MRRKLFLVLLLVFQFLKAFCQISHGNTWVTGGGNSYQYSFKDDKLSVFDTNFNFYFSKGNCNISDSNADLILVSDGYNLYNQSGGIIENGDTLIPEELYKHEDGWSSYSQSSIILPFEGNIYYLFTPCASDFEVDNYWNVPSSGRALFDLLLYHKVDMKLNGGAGKVIAKSKPLLENVKLSKTQMMACRHANGIDWWLLKQAHDTNMIYRFLVTKDSIYNMGTQGFAEPHFTKWDLVGQSMFNQDGTKYATVCMGINQFFYADFNRCNGLLSNPNIVNIANYSIRPPDTTLDIFPAGLCFSPSGNFLYIIKGYNIFQYEFGNGDSSSAWYHVANLDTTWNVFQAWSCAYLGPDNKMYVGNWNGLGNAMSYIENPDVKGAGCGFCPKCFRFPKIGAGSPPCMPNYGLGEKEELCGPIQTDELLLYPNPTNDYLNLVSSSFNNKEIEVQIYTLLGQTVYRKKMSTSIGKIQLDLGLLNTGVYILRVNDFVRKIMKL